MIEDLGIDLCQMMENAGRSLAHLVLSSYNPQIVTVLVGSGGNGGGGLVAARHLANKGIRVHVVTPFGESAFRGVPAQQFRIIQAMAVDVSFEWKPSLSSESHTRAAIIDALIGYSLQGRPRAGVAEAITWINSQSAPVISLDVPSGFDAETGTSREPIVAAEATLTLAAPKVGLLDLPAAGTVYLADISVPPSVFTPIVGRPGPELEHEWIVRLEK